MHRWQLIFTHRFPSSLIFRDKFFLCLCCCCSVVTSVKRCKTCRSLCGEKCLHSMRMRSLIKQFFVHRFASMSISLSIQALQRMLQVFYFFLSNKKRFSFSFNLWSLCSSKEIYEFPFDWSVWEILKEKEKKIFGNYVMAGKCLSVEKTEKNIKAPCTCCSRAIAYDFDWLCIVKKHFFVLPRWRKSHRKMFWGRFISLSFSFVKILSLHHSRESSVIIRWWNSSPESLDIIIWSGRKKIYQFITMTRLYRIEREKKRVLGLRMTLPINFLFQFNPFMQRYMGREGEKKGSSNN